MNVAFPANRRCIAEEFRDGANRRLDIRFRLFLRLKRFLPAERYCCQHSSTPGAEILRSKIFTGDLRANTRSRPAT